MQIIHSRGLSLTRTTASRRNVIDFDELIIVDRNACYYLEAYSFNDCKKLAEDEDKRQSIELNYMSFMSPSQLKVVLTNPDNRPKDTQAATNDDGNTLYASYDAAVESFLIRNDVINLDIISESTSFFKDYISFNNRYIKNFALIISDTISETSKRRLYRKFGEKYKDVFRNLHVKSFYSKGINGAADYNINHYRWDEIIIFLLLEEGIYSILAFLLGSDDSPEDSHEDYYAFLDAFRQRFGDRVDSIIEENIVIKNPTVNLKLENPDSIKRCQIEALIVLATKLLTAKEINYDLLFAAPSLFDIMKDLEQKYVSNKLNAKEKMFYIAGEVLDTISFLDVFYFGILQYTKKLSIKELTFTEEWRPTYQQYKEAKLEMLDDFQQAVNNRKLQHSEVYDLYVSATQKKNCADSVSIAIDRAFDFLYDLNKTSQNRSQPENEAFYNTLGRRSIFDETEMKRHHDTLKAAIAKLRWVDDREIDNNGRVRSAMEILFSRVKAFLNYLGGIDEKSKLQNYNTAVFPIVCFYANGIMSRDGYRFAYMVTDRKKRIKAVTSDELVFGQTYYCLPNVKRVAEVASPKYEAVWINPIIIPQSSYASIKTADFSHLKNREDYDRAAELLYYTDERIFGGLFGNVDTARLILPKLFDDRNSVFFRDYYYIAKTDGYVVGIISLYSELPSWNPDIIEKYFAEAGVEVTDSMREAYKYFKDTFNDSYGRNNTICDLCIEDRYRNKGFAKFLLYNVIQLVEDCSGDLTISVYSDNVPAIKLYSSMGFIPYIVDYDTRGQGSETNRYFKMIKYFD